MRWKFYWNMNASVDKSESVFNFMVKLNWSRTIDEILWTEVNKGSKSGKNRTFTERIFTVDNESIIHNATSINWVCVILLTSSGFFFTRLADFFFRYYYGVCIEIYRFNVDIYLAIIIINVIPGIEKSFYPMRFEFECLFLLPMLILLQTT